MKKLLVLLCFVAFAVGVLLLSLPLFINADAVKNQVVDAVKNATGAEPAILGGVHVEFFPSPKVTIEQVGIKNAPNALKPYIMQIQSVDVSLSFSEAFSNTPAFNSIVLNQPRIELETLQDGKLNWNVVFPSMKGIYTSLFELSKLKSFAFPNLIISAATVSYIDSRHGGAFSTFSDVGGVLLKDSNGISLDVKGDFRNTKLAVLGQIQFTSDQSSAPIELKMNAGASEFFLKGNINNTSTQAEIAANVKIKTDDLFDFVGLIKNKKSEVKDSTATQASDPKQKLPLDFVVDMKSTNDRFELKNMQFNSPFFQAKSDWVGDTKLTASNLNISIKEFDVDSFISSGVIGLFIEPKNTNSDTEQAQLAKIDTNALTDSLFGLTGDETVSINVVAEKFIVNKKDLTEIKITAEANGPFIDISNASVKLPGQSQANLIGSIKSGYQGVTFEGALDAWGLDFAVFSQLFGVSEKFLPEADFKRFRIKSDQVVASPVQTRVSDARMVIEGMGINGSVIANYEQALRVESRIELKKINLDNFIKHHTDLFSADEDTLPVYKKIPKTIADSIRNLHSSHTTRVLLEDFVFNEQTIPKAEFELMVNAAKFDLKDLLVNYRGANIAVSVGIENVPDGALPKYSIKMKSDTINTSTLTGEQADPVDAKKQAYILKDANWSKDQINVDWLDDVDLTYDIFVGDLKHQNWQLNNLSLKGNIADRKLSIDHVQANVWGADMAAKASLTGGKLPQLTLAFSLNKILISQLTAVTPLFKEIEGVFNLNGVLSSSGVSPYFLVSNLGGKIGVAGRDVLVKGFNLRRIVQAVSAVRSVADILNVVRQAFPGGETLITTVQGNFNVTNGKAQTSGIQLTTNESRGTLAGIIDLMQWKMNTSIDFELTTLQQSNPPILKLLFVGDLEGPEKVLDTKSLERFVDIKTTEKSLQGN
jgi:uncharacterized protein involved in outer membrane biogenesis